MSLKYKTIAFAVIAILVLYFNYPTVVNLLFDNKDIHSQTIKEKYAAVSKDIDAVKTMNLAVTDLAENRIKLLKNSTGNQILTVASEIFRSPMFDSILKGHFRMTQEGNSLFFELKPTAPKDVFLSDVSGKLNQLFQNVKKIDRVELRQNIPDIRFYMKKGRRLANTAEPILSIAGDEFDWLYNSSDESYGLSIKEYEYALNLGLDLKGGIYLDLGVDTKKVIEDQIRSKAEAIKTILINDKINPENVTVGNDNSIELHLYDPDKFDPESDAYATLVDGYTVEKTDYGYQFKITDDEIKRINKLTIDQALNTIRNRTDELGVKEPIISRKGDDSIIVQLPGVSNPDRAVNIIKKTAVLEFRLVSEDGSVQSPGEDDEVLNYEIKDPITLEITQINPVLLEKKVLLKGSSISDARVSYNQFNLPYVSMTFKSEYASLFGDITTNNRNRLLAIVLDNIVQSTPQINEPIYGGEAQISGNFSIEEASDLALVLRSGSLPAPLFIKEQKTVGASLGEDTIRQSLIALAIGFVCLIGFLIVWYKISGVFAVITLVFNLMLLVSFLAYFGATLTLPGFAGIVLTIGMAVDANVLIFERMREEIAHGETVSRKIINTSFKKSLSTIMDANLTTFFAALVLFQFGSGAIKGFAVTLSVGIFTSVFSAVLFTKLLLELAYVNRKKASKISV